MRERRGRRMRWSGRHRAQDELDVSADALHVV
jgi:hypothetical protein